MMLFRSIALVAIAALAGCAQTGNESVADQSSLSEAEDCFYLSQVNGFTDAPDADRRSDRIYVRVGASDTYLFETFGSCPDLNYSETIAFDQNGPGQICQGMDVDLLVPTSIGAQRCPVRMISQVEDSR